MKYVTITMLSLLVSASVATAQTSSQTFTMQIPAASSIYQDSLGNNWTLTIPSTIAIGTLQLTPATPVSLSLTNGVYNFSDTTHNLNMDSGYNPPTIGLYSGVNDSCQQWTWNGSQLSTPLSACGEAGFLTDNKAGFATLSMPGDALQILQSGPGYIIKDITTGNYFASNGVSGAGNIVTQSTPYVWSVTTVNSNGAAKQLHFSHIVNPQRIR
ncbi:MAG: hypothetical protein JO266_10130 [Acidobacteria bacterium]|nr:hypothetical protein [Acidobacteriota bacterium]